MQLVAGSERIYANPKADPVEGSVRWAPGKSLWIGGMSLIAAGLGPVMFTWDAFVLFLATTAITLCFGHSVGMHRCLIHRSFACPRWLEYACVYLGTLVGMAGPIGMVRIHDFRDWAQRQSDCHAFFCHRRPFFLDAWWQLHCVLSLQTPPEFRPEPRLGRDQFYLWVERTWMLQQLPWAVLFFALGGWSWLVWGVPVRVAVSVTGHWMVGHFAHRQGEQHWIVEGAAVQGHNVRIAGLISMGESWHNNHHAFPGSARLGLYPGQVDLGWRVIRAFGRLGCAWSVVTPDLLPPRPELRQLIEPPSRQRINAPLHLSQG